MPIVQTGDPVLRKKAAPVEDAAFGTPALAGIIEAMRVALDAEHDGVAIAAPQIGISKRIFLVRYDRMKPVPKEGEPEPVPEVGVYVNPKITRRSRKKEEADEGCLSVRGTYGKIMRATRATVEARDEHGKTFSRGAGGILAQAFQHETDHLDGVLFIDNATNLTTANVAERPRRTNGWEEPE